MLIWPPNFCAQVWIVEVEVGGEGVEGWGGVVMVGARYVCMWKEWVRGGRVRWEHVCEFNITRHRPLRLTIYPSAVWERGEGRLSIEQTHRWREGKWVRKWGRGILTNRIYCANMGQSDQFLTLWGPLPLRLTYSCREGGGVFGNHRGANWERVGGIHPMILSI